MSLNTDFPPEDITILRDACMARYEQLNELLGNGKIPLEAREVIKRRIKDLERVWGKLPDEGFNARVRS